MLMNPRRLDPTILSAAIYDRSGKSNKKIEGCSENARIIYVFSGDIQCSVNQEKPQRLSSASLLYIPANTPFSIKGQYLRAAVIVFSLAGEPVSTADDSIDFRADTTLLVDGFEAVWDDAQRICDLMLSEDGYSVAKAEATLKLLLIRLAEATDVSALPLRMNETLDDYVREHAGEEISNTEVGAIFGYHPFYVSTVIKEKRGVTLRQYVIAYRLRIARSLLDFTDKTVAEIAEETGFTDASYFTKTFKAAFGKTPKEWRAESKMNSI